MKLDTDPRPPSIWVACLCFIGAALWALIAGLRDLGAVQSRYATVFPDLDWSRDGTIVVLSAEFTIALIPVFWIFFVARPFARVMVSALGVWKLWWLSGSDGLSDMVQMGLIALSMLLLFTPGAYRWFERERT